MFYILSVVRGRGGGLVILEGDRGSNLMKLRFYNLKGLEVFCESVLVYRILEKVDEDDEDSFGYVWWCFLDMGLFSIFGIIFGN